MAELLSGEFIIEVIPKLDEQDIFRREKEKDLLAFSMTKEEVISFKRKHSLRYELANFFALNKDKELSTKVVLSGLLSLKLKKFLLADTNESHKLYIEVCVNLVNKETLFLKVRDFLLKNCFISYRDDLIDDYYRIPEIEKLSLFEETAKLNIEYNFKRISDQLNFFSRKELRGKYVFRAYRYNLYDVSRYNILSQKEFKEKFPV